MRVTKISASYQILTAQPQAEPRILYRSGQNKWTAIKIIKTLNHSMSLNQ